MVKRTSCLASNQAFQVQILVGVLIGVRSASKDTLACVADSIVD